MEQVKCKSIGHSDTAMVYYLDIALNMSRLHFMTIHIKVRCGQWQHSLCTHPF